MSEDAATLQKNIEMDAIKFELQRINSASDLLRSVEDERQYNKLQLLLLSICFVTTIYQETTLSIAHNDVMPDSIPKYGNDPRMYNMYKHHIKNKVMTGKLNWGQE
jgi:hypothetical protein